MRTRTDPPPPQARIRGTGGWEKGTQNTNLGVGSVEQGCWKRKVPAGRKVFQMFSRIAMSTSSRGEEAIDSKATFGLLKHKRIHPNTESSSR